MSRRTSESNKAIAQAWEREQQRVSEGNGTRDWTLDQQRDILERGKAYDDNGKSFEGQHMRSAEMYPEYQGNPDNIQFLTREEHLAAHDGDWRKPTNWYYNPVTKEKRDFGDGPIIPCEVIKLSERFNIQITEEVSVNDSVETVVTDKEETVNSNPETGPPIQNQSKSYKEKQKTLTVNIPTSLPPISGFIGIVKKVAKVTGKFLLTHKSEIIAGGLAIGGTIIKAAIDSNGSAGNSGNSDNELSTSYSRNYSPNLDEKFSESLEDDDFSEDGRDYPNERQSPREHDVSGYTRVWNGKEIHVDQYKRGGKKTNN